MRKSLTQQGMQKGKKIVFVLIVLASSINISIQQATDYKQKVDNNIPDPTLIQIEPQKVNISTEVTLPTIIQPPQLIYPLYYASYDFTFRANCTFQENDLEKRIGDYIKFRKGQLGKFQGWNVQIIDGTYDQKQQIFYALLTNGSILKTMLRKKINNQNKISVFERWDYHDVNSIENVWQLDKYELYLSEGLLYMLKDKHLFTIEVSIINDTITTTTTPKWQLNPVPQGENITSLYHHSNTIYLIRSKTIHQLINGTISPSLLLSSPQQYLKRNFISMSIDNDYMYVLCKANGVYLIDMTSGYSIVSKYKFQFHEYAYKVTAKNNTLLVNFKLYRKSYVGEFLIIHTDIASDPPAFRLNKFYYRQIFTYKRFDQMTKIIMFQDFALIHSPSQINIFQHSINRKSPFNERDTQQLYRASFPKILDVIQLDEKKLHYIIVEKNGVFVESFGGLKQHTLFGAKINCVFEQSGIYDFNITYQGFCIHPKTPTESYCTQAIQYRFDVNDQKTTRSTQAFNNHLFYGLLLALLFVLVIGAVLTYRRYTLERQEKLFAILQKKQLNNDSQMKNVS